MSWAAHEFENYLLQKKFTRHGWVTPSFLAIVIGTLVPDMFTKTFAYGAHDDAARIHRGWPGLGFSHSFMFGVVLGVVVLWLTRNRAWAVGLVLGQFAHVISDIGDTAGVMPFFPFSTENVTFGLWRYSAAAGAYGDGAAYYSGPGVLWDLGWLLLTLLVAWRALTATYFRDVVVPADAAAWEWLRRTFRVREGGLLLIYRGVFFYGIARMLAWFIHARLNTTLPFELVWGGPTFVQGADLSDAGVGEVAVRTVVGGALFVGFVALAWRVFIRNLWKRSGSGPLRGAGVPAATHAVVDAGR